MQTLSKLREPNGSIDPLSVVVSAESIQNHENSRWGNFAIPPRYNSVKAPGRSKSRPAGPQAVVPALNRVASAGWRGTPGGSVLVRCALFAVQNCIRGNRAVGVQWRRTRLHEPKKCVDAVLDKPSSDRLTRRAAIVSRALQLSASASLILSSVAEISSTSVRTSCSFISCRIRNVSSGVSTNAIYV